MYHRSCSPPVTEGPANRETDGEAKDRGYFGDLGIVAPFAAIVPGCAEGGSGCTATRANEGARCYQMAYSARANQPKLGLALQPGPKNMVHSRNQHPP